jgi:hypothetical protein
MASKFQKHQAIETAITNNDYKAFIIAFNAEQANKKTNHKGNTVTKTLPTQEQFAIMVKKNQNRLATKKAIEANDYNAFVTAYSANVPTQSEFDTMVKFDKAIKSNDGRGMR